MTPLITAPDSAETLMTVAEVARFLKFSRDKVYRMVHNDEIPYIRIGTRSLRFKKQQIEEWLTTSNLKHDDAVSKVV